ncbi:hypothetical protein K0U83_04400 [bacterium]|nr:hypothetical protein [bacterium]
MKNIFDTNARADEALVGGEPAARAVGLPTSMKYPGTMAPGGSNATADALIAPARQKTQSMLEEQPATAPGDPIVGYNPDTNQVFSGGKAFQLDLNEGRQNAALLDVNNDTLPAGFLRVRSSNIKRKLAQEYEGLDIIDDSQRAFGQMASGIGSALRDVGADSVGPALEQFGGDIARRNPSKINSFQDIVDSPLVTAGEAVGETGFEVGRYATLGAAGTAAGAALGAGLTAATGGLAAPTIPVFAFLGNRVANWTATFAQTYGGIRSEQREAGIDNKDRAAAAAFGSSALDFLLGPEMRVMRAISSPVTKAITKPTTAVQARDLLAQGVPAGTGRYGVNAAIDAGGEFGTEIAQTGLERFGAEKDLTSADALNEYAVAGIKGGIGGAALSPVGTAAENKRQVVEQMPAFLEAQNFMQNLQADIDAAGDPNTPSAERLKSAKRAQDVLRGSSDDPEFDAVLQEFKQKLASVDNELVRIGTKQALDQGPVNLMMLDASPQQDMFNRAAAQTSAPATEFDRTAADPTQWRTAPVAGDQTPPVIDNTAPGQQEMFGETGAPTYAADPSFGESQFEFNQNVQGPPITPGQRTVAGFPALNATMDQIQSGQIAREGLPVTGELTPGQQAALVTPTPLDPIQRALRGVSLDLDQPTTTDTIEPVSKVVGAPATLTPSAPAAEGAFSGEQMVTRPNMPGFQFLPPQQGQETPQADDDGIAADIQTTLQAADKKPVGRNPLAASVEGAQGVTAPGKRSLTDAQVARITNAAVDLEARGKRLPAKDRGIITALVNFGRAYQKYLNAAGNMQRPGQVIKRGATAEGAVEDRVANATDMAQAVKDALAALGTAVGGNAKDVDVLVATIKAASQGKINTITDPETIKLYKRLDSMISQAWTASKAESFIDELDMFYTRQQPTRAAREAKDQTSPLVKAATEGFGNPKGTATAENTYSGFLGVLQYIRFYGTGYERLLARQIREALKNSRNVPKVEFIEKGTPRYDPKKNTIYLRNNESNSVVLHEGLHAALQWFVYQNPNNAAVKQLKKSLKAVVEYNGSLGAKAKEVQDLLKKLVADGNETDAVLELMSYGNTLNDFRKALEAMPRSTTPKTFYEAVQDVWQSALAVIQQLLGNSKTEASAVIQSTWDLLAQVGEGDATAPKTRQGNVLEAAITDDGMVDVANMTAMQAAQNPAAATQKTSQ